MKLWGGIKRTMKLQLITVYISECIIMSFRFLEDF